MLCPFIIITITTATAGLSAAPRAFPNVLTDLSRRLRRVQPLR